jgi:thiol:disulfide interchange protein DsbC
MTPGTVNAHKRAALGLLALALLGVVTGATAKDIAPAKFLKALHERFPNTVGAAVAPAFPGFWAIAQNGRVVFVKNDLSLLITGDVVDLKTNESLSARLVEANRAKLRFADLPLNQAIRIGTGGRRLVVFSDPDCLFCQKVEAELAQLKDVSIFIVPFPIAQLHPEAPAKAAAIWCSKDPAGAWRDYLMHGLQPEPAQAGCKPPIDEMVALGQKLGITGTPTLIFEDGTVMPGAVSAARIEAQLALPKR